MAKPPMSRARRDVDTLGFDYSLFTISIPHAAFACCDFEEASETRIESKLFAQRLFTGTVTLLLMRKYQGKRAESTAGEAFAV